MGQKQDVYGTISSTLGTIKDLGVCLKVKEA